MKPHPLKLADVTIGGQYVVVAACAQTGALDYLFVECRRVENGDGLRFVNLRSPTRNGINFRRPMFSPDEIGLSGKSDPNFLWRTFRPDDEAAALLADIVARQDKNAYAKLLAAS